MRLGLIRGLKYETWGTRGFVADETRGFQLRARS